MYKNMSVQQHALFIALQSVSNIIISFTHTSYCLVQSDFQGYSQIQTF